MSILAAILGFNVLILVHELGHFVFARLSGMRVQTFSVGFGPAILRFTRGQTVYQIAAFPVGGYVRIHGQGPDERDGSADNFHARPWVGRVATVLAGPMFNLGLAALVYVFLFGSSASIYLDGSPEGTTLVRSAQGPAAAAGLREGDLIEAVNGQPVRSNAELARAVGAAAGDAVTLRVARPPEGRAARFEAEPVSRYPGFESPRYAGINLLRPHADADWPRLDLPVVPERSAKGPRIGVGLEYARFGTEAWHGAFGAAGRETLALTGNLVRTLTRAIKGEEKVKLASAVKITEMGADTFERGPIWFFQFLAFLSINLALINLLPLPALDGGRLLFLLVEAVARRPINRRAEAAVHALGMVLLLGLIVVVTATDILSYF